MDKVGSASTGSSGATTSSLLLAFASYHTFLQKLSRRIAPSSVSGPAQDLNTSLLTSAMPIEFPRDNTSSISYPSSESSSSAASSTASSDDDRDEESAMIQAEWEESLRQMEMVLSIVIIPFFGKWWGRKWAYWAYDRYLHIGLGRSFFGLR
ncbi:uncharacterized protein MKK02DRAFT_45001 [Dioszegia hungarica]|uniref:Uncharacterized protein n=1 Tax=Dioszegia hungarica TaxID=4972 RepID=A0AA38HC96_9TREE|nr:uncharacterized protein MKK02DRAFT_45001 [Dioszegia hungarica]KAI9636296.1 hypothetical protein MKK02DRAFT_45001 [Dioszegia hungarica]